MSKRTNSLLFFALCLVSGICTAYVLPDFRDVYVPVFTGLLLMGFLFLKRQKLSPRSRLIFLLFLSFAWGISRFQLADFRNNAALPLGTGTYAGTVAEAKAPKTGRQQLIVRLKYVLDDDSLVPLNERIVLTVSNENRIMETGDEICFTGELKSVENRGNPGEFNAEFYYRTKGIRYRSFCSDPELTGHSFSIAEWFARRRNELCGMMENYLEDDALAIGKALLFGDNSDLDQALLQSFSATGTTHVLAVSGLHIGLILLLLQKFLQLFHRLISRRQAIVLSIVLVIFYGLLTGASPSVMRAVIMFTILSSAQLFGRGNDSLGALGFCAILQLSWNPWYLFDLGFQLSYTALLGIFLLYKPIMSLWEPKRRLIRLAWEGTAAGIAATVFTTPIVLYNFYRFPNYFALANLGIMLFGFLVLALGILFLLTSFVPFVSKLTALAFSVSVIGMVLWVKLIDSLPGAVSGGFHLELWEMLFAYALITAWILHLGWSLVKRSYLLIATALLIAFWSWNRFSVLRSKELVIMNSSQFCLVVKEGKSCYALYDKDKNGSWAIPDELKNYAAYTGAGLIPLKFEGSTLSGKIGKETIALNRQKDGIEIVFRDKRLFYRQRGVPGFRENARLFSPETRLYVQSEDNEAYRWKFD